MRSEPPDEASDALEGYVALIGAILQRALADTRLSIRHGDQGHTHPTHEDQEEARALLLSHERLRFFCELMGAEVSGSNLRCSPRPACSPPGLARSPVAPRTAYALATLAGPVQTEAQRQVAAERAILDCIVRQRMALAHPDRWPDTPLAHELTVALVALRTTLQPGAKRGSSTGR